MASWVFSSIQSLSSKVLEAVRGTTRYQQDPASPAANQNENVIKDLEKLSRMLVRIQVVLQDAEEREIHDRQVRLWLTELRGVAYQAEDVLDEFHYEVLSSIVQNGDAAIERYHEERGMKRKFAEMYTISTIAPTATITITLIPDGMSEKIKNITERFEEICNARRDLQLREEDGTRLVGLQIRPPTSSYVDDRAIFGRKEDKEKIISLLHPSNGPEFMVLPIVGMGGLGKTTLAQLVYNDVEISKLFKKKAWVSVSEDFNVVHLTKAVIESVRNSACSFSELSKLQDVLNKEIRGVSLLLVLDDVWNEDRNIWERFRVGFLGASIVRILTTTRSTKVAKIMQTTSPFPLGSLPMEKCLSLFNHFAFGTKEAISENANLLKISRNIVEKCRGLPLAIKALGGVLRYEMDEEKWIEVSKNDILKIDENSEISQALKLSYHKLPVHLRPCFLYLTMFPKGRPFQKNKVVRLWIAQGYVTDNPVTQKTLEEIGSEYFDELQTRSLIDYRYNDNMYCLHDLIHDLARSISLGTKHPVLEHDQQWNNLYDVGHLHLTKEDGPLGSLLAPGNHGVLRTLRFFGGKNSANSIVSSEIACLRALELRYSKLLNGISTLKHLRYLSMVRVEMEKFPETICLLYNLQSLILDCSNVLELPESIKTLINLRYLKLHSKKIEQLPESIVLLHNLHTLSLERCIKLTKLPRNLEQLKDLCVLKTFKHFTCKLPFGTGKLRNLKSFYGSFYVMGDDMGCLGELKNLNKLSGSLYISGLQNIADVECCNANLASKPNLQMVIINFDHGPYGLREVYDDYNYKFWKHYNNHRNKDPKLFLAIGTNNTIRNENAKKTQEDVLNSLQPHKNLKVLHILHYRGIKLSSWLLHSSLIVKQPINLCFMSLEELKFTDMPNLVEWEACDSHFPCLKILIIRNCPKLLKVVIPQKVEMLQLESCGCEVIKFSSKSKLQIMSISDCRELFSIYYRNGDLSHLRYISIASCPNLLTFSAILEESKKVDTGNFGFQEIEFASESDINLKSDYRELNPLNFKDGYTLDFRSVSIYDCPKLRLFSAIPVGAHVLAIHNCGFSDMMLPSKCTEVLISLCPKLTSIIWENGGLNSLIQIIKFNNCPRLGYIRIPRKAKEVRISSCGVQDIIFPSQSMIQILHIKHCLNLFSVHWKEVPVFKELLLEGCHGLSSISVIPSEIHQLVLFECGLHEISFPMQCKIASACISRCLDLTSLHFLEDLPLLETFLIKSCPSLFEALVIPNQLKELDISDCNIPEIRLLPKSNLHKLSITKCAQLAAIKELQAQCLLISLHISQCPILRFSMAVVLRPMMGMVHMYECSGMDFYRDGKSFFYEGDAMVDRIIASDDKKIFLDSTQERSIPLLKNSELQFLKGGFSQVMEAFELPPLSERSCQYIKLQFPSLVELEIRNCRTVVSIAGLDNLSNLRCLVISVCPELCEWKDTTLPAALQFLELIFCHKLICTPLQWQPVQNYPASLKVVIKYCPLLRESCRRITTRKLCV